MVEEPYRKTKYTVTIVPKGSLPQNDPTQEKIANPPRYNREVDEPAFKRAWQKVKEMQELGLVKPRPPIPANGIGPRRPRAKPSD